MYKIIKQKEYTSETTPKIYATEKEMKYKKPSVLRTGNSICKPRQVHIMVFVIKLPKLD